MEVKASDDMVNEGGVQQVEEQMEGGGHDHAPYTQRVGVVALMYFGLSMILHSIIDGFFHGVFRNKSDFGVLIFSLVVHKIPLAIAFGTAFKVAGHSPADLHVLLLLVLYVLSAPIGVYAGTNLKISDKSIPMIVLQALSAGTFVYVGACDLLVH